MVWQAPLTWFTIACAVVVGILLAAGCGSTSWFASSGLEWTKFVIAGGTLGWAVLAVMEKFLNSPRCCEFKWLGIILKGLLVVSPPLLSAAWVRADGGEADSQSPLDAAARDSLRCPRRTVAHQGLLGRPAHLVSLQLLPLSGAPRIADRAGRSARSLAAPARWRSTARATARPAGRCTSATSRLACSPPCSSRRA